MTDREENALAIDIAGRFKAGKGEDGGNYKYLLVATFRAAKWNWKEASDEVTEEVQQQEKEKEEDTEDAFRPQDPIQKAVAKEQEPTKEQESKESEVIEVKGLKSKSSGSKPDPHEQAQPYPLCILL